MTQHSHNQSHGHSHSLKDYYIVYVLLLVLLFATVGIAYIHLGALNLWVAMLIATIKAGLVVWIFMHVREASRLVLVFAGAAVVMLLICFLLTMADYATRW